MTTSSLPRMETGMLSVSFLPDDTPPWRWQVLCIRHGAEFTEMQQQTVGTILGRQIQNAGIQIDEGLLFTESLGGLLGPLIHSQAKRACASICVLDDGYQNPVAGAEGFCAYLKKLPVDSTVCLVSDPASLQMLDLILGIKEGAATGPLFPRDQAMCMISFSTAPNGDPVITEIAENPCGVTPKCFTAQELKIQLGIS